jgi:hypothetical protein
VDTGNGQRAGGTSCTASGTGGCCETGTISLSEEFRRQEWPYAVGLGLPKGSSELPASSSAGGGGGGRLLVGSGLPNGSSELPSFSQLFLRVVHTLGRNLTKGGAALSWLVRPAWRGLAKTACEPRKVVRRAAINKGARRCVMPKSFPGESADCHHGNRERHSIPRRCSRRGTDGPGKGTSCPVFRVMSASASLRARLSWGTAPSAL